MLSTPWILIAVLVVLIILGILAIIIAKKNKRPTDYYALFMIGLIWCGAGIPMAVSSKNYALPAMGFIFMIIGLANRKKWKENRRTWDQLDKKERKSKLIIIIILGALILAGLVAYFLTNNRT